MTECLYNRILGLFIGFMLGMAAFNLDSYFEGPCPSKFAEKGWLPMAILNFTYGCVLATIFLARRWLFVRSEEGK